MAKRSPEDEALFRLTVLGEWHAEERWREKETNQQRFTPQQQAIHDFIYHYEPALKPLVTALRQAFPWR